MIGLLEHIEKEINLIVLKKSTASDAQAEAYDFCLGRMYLVLRKENDRIERADIEQMNANLEVKNKIAEMSYSYIFQRKYI